MVGRWSRMPLRAAVLVRLDGPFWTAQPGRQRQRRWSRNRRARRGREPRRAQRNNAMAPKVHRRRRRQQPTGSQWREEWLDGSVSELVEYLNAAPTGGARRFVIPVFTRDEATELYDCIQTARLGAAQPLLHFVEQLEADERRALRGRAPLTVRTTPPWHLVARQRRGKLTYEPESTPVRLNVVGVATPRADAFFQIGRLVGVLQERGRMAVLWRVRRCASAKCQRFFDDRRRSRRGSRVYCSKRCRLAAAREPTRERVRRVRARRAVSDR